VGFPEGTSETRELEDIAIRFNVYQHYHKQAAIVHTDFVSSNTWVEPPPLVKLER
jgi:hypothetical protein